MPAFIAGCSIEISQPGTATGSPILKTTSPMLMPTTLIPIAGINQPTSIPTSPTPVSAPTAKMPVTWANLKLTGRMVFTTANMQQNNPTQSIQVLDLATGEISTVFQTTGLSWLYYMTASPVAGQIVMSYSPPTGYNSPTQQALYILTLDGSKLPQLLFNPPALDDQYLQVEWSPDGKYIYYVHSSSRPQYQGQFYPVYEIFRMAYPDGKPEKIAENAFWPRLSLDASRLVYISSSPTDGKNKIFLANADGSDARQVPLAGQNIPDIIDAPIFSPDGQSLLFSAPTPAQTDQPNWLEKLLGVQAAEAHAIASDWWSVPLSGGSPRQLTHIQSPILFASVSPDGRYIASYSGNGLFVMKPDGTGLATIIPDLGGIAGEVNWIP
jgi:Tol biopolymer transport system component